MRVTIDLIEDLTRRSGPLNPDIMSSKIWNVGMDKFDQGMLTMMNKSLTTKEVGANDNC
jgi:hypothetical protein